MEEGTPCSTTTFQTVNYTNGDRYVGQVRGGEEQLLHGYGRYTSSNGDWYEGEWANDKKNGVGKYQYATGQMYEGQWLDDEKQGYGIYKYSSGDTYRGQYEVDQHVGYGIYFRKGQNVTHKGYFRDDTMCDLAISLCPGQPDEYCLIEEDEEVTLSEAHVNRINDGSLDFRTLYEQERNKNSQVSCKTFT